MAKAGSRARICHSFIPSFLGDRLRAVNCPSDMIDQIGGWSSGKLGEKYGKGYDLKEGGHFECRDLWLIKFISYYTRNA